MRKIWLHRVRLREKGPKVADPRPRPSLAERGHLLTGTRRARAPRPLGRVTCACTCQDPGAQPSDLTSRHVTVLLCTCPALNVVLGIWSTLDKYLLNK